MASAFDLPEIPMSEAELRFRVQILQGSVVLREIETGAVSIVYPVADQIADFGTDVSSFTCRIAQLGARGWGAALERDHRQEDHIMAETARLELPLILASQARKHVTHNEALAKLDALVQLTVHGFDAQTPPVSAVDGEVWALGAAPSGDWAGQAGMLAARIAGGWEIITPAPGWRAAIGWDVRVFDGSVWRAIPLATGGFDRATFAQVLTEEVAVASGSSVQTSIVIPNRAKVLAVSIRVSAAISGAASFDCGIAGDTAKFGGFLGTDLGSSNIGVIGSEAFYADTPVVLTANGLPFSGGSVRVALHLLTSVAPV